MDLTFTPAAKLAALYRSRKVSPLEVMRAVLDRIDRVNPRVNAIVTLARESALREARRATAALRRGAELPPLFGIPVGIKDVTPTRGLRTTHGSKLFEDHVPDADALVVERLRAAGAIVIGKTNTPEFAFGPNTVNAVFGATRNPWDVSRTAGGSSGGSAAALATGMCPLAEGTDLGGSLRGPAAFCGVVGFRTTPGLIPRVPSVLAWDTYLFGRGPDGPHGRRRGPHALGDGRAGRSVTAVLPRGRTRVPESGEGSFSEGLAHRVDARSRPGRDRPRGVRAVRAGGRHVPRARRPRGRRLPRHERRAGDRATHPRIADGRPPRRQARRMARGASARPRREHGAGPGPDSRDIAEGELLRTRQWLRVHEFFGKRDLLVTPTMAVPAFPIEHPHVIEINGRPAGKAMARSLLTYASSVLGLPAISIPCGFTMSGLPVGLQIVGKRRGEAAVLRAAAAFEAARPWGDRIPSMVTSA